MKPNRPEDFWRFVEKIPGIDCWIWTGKDSGHRYGAFNIGGKVIKAHRFAWELVHGPIPEGMHVLHRCDLGFCVRDDHLFLGTHGDNMQDKGAKGRVVAYKGEANGFAKLDGNAIFSIRDEYASGARQVDLAAKYGIGQTHVSRIIRKEVWKHLKEGSSNGNQ